MLNYRVFSKIGIELIKISHYLTMSIKLMTQLKAEARKPRMHEAQLLFYLVLYGTCTQGLKTGSKVVKVTC